MTKSVDTQSIPAAQTKRGRKAITEVASPEPQLKPEAVQELTQDMDFARQVDAAVHEQSEIYRLTGQIQALKFMRKTADTSQTILLRQIKESKQYKGMRTLKEDSPFIISTWENFCDLIVGRSQQLVDEDIRNLAVLGAEFMEASNQMGLGYRQLRQLRALPEDERNALMYKQDGKTLRTDDPDVLKDWLEDAQLEKAKAREEVKNKEADRKALEQVLETKDKALNKAQTELAKLKNLDPDARMALMAEKEAKGREELAAQGAEVLSMFGKFLATAVGIQSMEGVTPTAASAAHVGVCSLCESLAGMLPEYGYDIDFKGMLFPEWLEEMMLWKQRGNEDQGTETSN